MKRLSSKLTGERAAAYGVLAVTVAVIFASFAPGHINVDSVSQIQETDKAAFTNRHAPLLLALWYPLFKLGLGLGFVLLAQVAVFALGGYIVLRVALGRVAATTTTAFICFWPPVFGMLGSVGRDAWFTALMLLTYGLCARAAQRSWPLRARWLALAAVALWLALASRQNAAPAMLPAAMFIVGLVIQHLATAGRARARALVRRPLVSTFAAGAVLMIAMFATQVIGTKVIKAEDVDPEQYLYIYDLAALSEREGENLFPADVAPDRGLEALTTRFSVDSMVDLIYFEPLVIAAPLEPSQLGSLRSAWLDQLTADPLEYIGARGELFARQLTLTRRARSVYIGDVGDNPFGYRIWFPGVSSAALDYLDLFTEPEAVNPFFSTPSGGPLYTVWLYLLISAVAAAALISRRSAAEQLAVGALAVSALTLQPGLFVAAMGTEFRFELPALAAAMFAAPVTIAVVLRSRTSARTPGDRGARPARS